ncbi:hypothetical protein Q4488_14065 [Amphritea sp. 1_MG-2023]|uniref:hypothetical protein n=1 Tax=Amphritea sp. 1_MG-2023 TaxID=3062670 RepID=UPI0026E15951|nr:hypothetical protein [Amphritea sp. 1_MG-2023]MDO6564512.1 hypothetical protein [Amphritea sp. 1_MG-2023]
MRFPMYSSTVVCTPLIPFVINPSWRSHDLLSDTLPIEVSALSNHMPDAHEAIK